MADFSQYTKQKRQLLSSFIAGYFAEKKSQTKEHLVFQKEAISRLEQTVQKGKMLRGIFSLLVYELCGGRNVPEMLPVAAAIEIMHTGLLIHDDIMDKDALRRGMPTMYTQYSEDVAGKVQNETDYGKAMAICVGDLAFFMAFALISEMSVDNKLILEALDTIAHELQLVGYAQMQDYDFGQTGAEPSKDEIFSVYRYKTARYTFSLPFMLGALFAGADQPVQDKLAEIGETLGIIFQIKDDELGIFGSEDEIGKIVGSDIRENKKTLFRQLILQNANEEDGAKLNNIFGNTALNSSDVDYVRSSIKKYGVDKSVQDEISTMETNLAHQIQNLPFDENTKKLLQQVSSFNLKRRQ